MTDIEITDTIPDSYYIDQSQEIEFTGFSTEATLALLPTLSASEPVTLLPGPTLTYPPGKTGYLTVQGASIPTLYTDRATLNVQVDLVDI